LRGLQTIAVDLVDAPGSDRLVDDQAGFLQDLEVLGDRGPPDRQVAGDLDHCLWPVAEALKDGSPRAIPESVEDQIVRFH
jgi:hypothetical protein